MPCVFVCKLKPMGGPSIHSFEHRQIFQGTVCGQLQFRIFSKIKEEEPLYAKRCVMSFVLKLIKTNELCKLQVQHLQ